MGVDRVPKEPESPIRGWWPRATREFGVGQGVAVEFGDAVGQLRDAEVVGACCRPI